MKKVNVLDAEISYYNIEETDYISLTDMVRNIEDGLGLIEKWLRNKNTIEFLGVWEDMYNKDFNSTEFEGIKNEAGTNRFMLSVKKWIEKTNAKGITAKTGRYGGTYAHKDIAFEFASWVSPQYLASANSSADGNVEKYEIYTSNSTDASIVINPDSTTWKLLTQGELTEEGKMTKVYSGNVKFRYLKIVAYCKNKSYTELAAVKAY